MLPPAASASTATNKPFIDEGFPFFPPFGLDEEAAAIRGISVDFGRRYISTIRLSGWYFFYCVLALFMSITLTLLLVVRDNSVAPPWSMVAVDAVVVVMLAAEVVLEMLLLKRHFFCNGWHLCDLAVLAVSTLGLLLLAIEASEQLPRENDVLVLCFTVVRYVSQSVRALRYLLSAKGSRESRLVVTGDCDVSFPEYSRSRIEVLGGGGGSSSVVLGHTSSV